MIVYLLTNHTSSFSHVVLLMGSAAPDRQLLQNETFLSVYTGMIGGGIIL